ncbi:hypothetical protein QQS21_010202 [Conoideocrella luteorostrata]|uniref:Pre-mRNA-splicing factor n=1 Tax=Conoideocrella luteorostrata TaxID=1105319 RepID=A0AAJ0CFK8_9HYPO|nr:hypothetical protein QQS21_010202 [Conoideocrella luteorostrata]
MAESSKGRIAIKFGSSTSSSRPPPPPTSLGKRSRRAALGNNSDSESDHDHDRGRHETITGFGADGAETEHKTRSSEKERKNYVIARQANRDWRADVKAQRQGRNLLPEEARQQQNGSSSAAVEIELTDQDTNLQWGLSIKDKRDSHQEPQLIPQPKQAAPRDQPARTADEEALDALLGNRKEPEKTIQAPSEDDVYKRDAAEAGATSTLEDYEAMPVEEFGAALLRGMGWDGEHTGPKTKEIRKRQNRLGLGAKELKDVEDLGGWKQNGAKKSRPRLADYRREESKRKERMGRDDSYKREREREKERERGGYRDGRERDHYRDDRRDRDQHRHRSRDHDRDRRR